jgi:AraC-like DNA-binding protein
MRSQLVAPFLAAVRAAGGKPETVIAEVGLPENAEKAGDLELPLSRLHHFFEVVERETHDPMVGVHVAEALPRGTYGLVEYCVRSSPTVRESLERLARYITLLNDLVVLSFTEQGGEGLMEQRIPGVPACIGRHGNEFFVSELLLQGRRLSGLDFAPRRVWFAHSAPAQLPSLVQTVGTSEITFDAGSNGFALGLEVLDAPLESYDPSLLAILDRQLERYLSRRARPTDFLQLVERRVRDRFVAGDGSSLEAIAEALKMSARTLQRRLADEGVSFAQLTDGVRRELALRYVKDPARQLAEVAFMLGYTEISAFFHAFKRWTGTTPTKYRATRDRA